MKMFLLGAPCAGKTTLIKALREVLDCPVLDMDDELLRLNGGIWPSLHLKRGLSSLVIDEASRLGDVVLAYSVVDDEQLGALIAAEWVICLLDLPEEVMRDRADERLAREGWTNIEWLPFHLDTIEDLRARKVFSHVVDATLPIAMSVHVLVDLMNSTSLTPTSDPS
jgi:hypothetical protein